MHLLLSLWWHSANFIHLNLNKFLYIVGLNIFFEKFKMNTGADTLLWLPTLVDYFLQTIKSHAVNDKLKVMKTYTMNMDLWSCIKCFSKGFI